MKKNLLLVCAAFPALGSAQSFNLIGDLAGGAVHSAAAAVNNNGTAVGHSMTALNAEGVVWSQGSGLTGLGVFSGTIASHAYAISADGLTIAGNSGSSSTTNKAMVWRNGSYIALSDLPGGDNNASISALSGDGRVAVGYGYGTGWSQALKWTMGADGAETSRTVLLDLAGGVNRAQAFDISADGQNVVGYGSIDGGWDSACIWKNGGTTPTALGTIPIGGSQSSMANSISADGKWVVGRVSAADGMHAFRWSEQTGMLDMGDFSGGFLGSQANAVSGDGKIVIGYGTPSDNKATPFLWTEETGMLDLQQYLIDKGLDLSSLNGGKLYIASDISADGRYIVGQVAFQNGTYGGFVADLGAAPVPEPATLGALSIGALGLLRRKRKNR